MLQSVQGFWLAGRFIRGLSVENPGTIGTGVV